MNSLLHLLATYGLAVVFANLFAEQMGLPVPAYPVLVLMGAWSVDGRHDAGAVFAVAVAACLLADGLWYAGGRRFGGRVLRTVSKLSMSPDSCVRQTEALFARWGVWSLLVAKFVPGFGTIAVPSPCALEEHLSYLGWRTYGFCRNKRVLVSSVDEV